MCYHVKMTERLDLVAKRLGLLPPRGNHQDLFTPEMHFNGFSFPWMPILTNSDPKQMKLGKWWLMQPWQREFDAGAHNCLNTRIENVNKSNPNIDKRIFSGLGENFELDTSMRQFTSNANTRITNDQGAFAQFLYGNMPSCKDGDVMMCGANDGGSPQQR